jgi:hypothetical protein
MEASSKFTQLDQEKGGPRLTREEGPTPRESLLVFTADLVRK